MNQDWIDIHVSISLKDFVKETEKSHCFKFWGRKFVPIPKKFEKRYEDVAGFAKIILPRWFIIEHKMEWFVDEEDKFHFPKKEKKVKPEKELPLLDTIPTQEQLNKSLPIARQVVEAGKSVGPAIKIDEDIPF